METPESGRIPTTQQVTLPPKADPTTYVVIINPETEEGITLRAIQTVLEDYQSRDLILPVGAPRLSTTDKYTDKFRLRFHLDHDPVPEELSRRLKRCEGVENIVKEKEKTLLLKPGRHDSLDEVARRPSSTGAIGGSEMKALEEPARRHSSTGAIGGLETRFLDETI